MSDTQQVLVTELVVGDEVLEGGFMVGSNDYSKVVGLKYVGGKVRVTWPGNNDSTFGLGHKCTIKKRS